MDFLYKFVSDVLGFSRGTELSVAYCKNEASDYYVSIMFST